MTLQKDGAILFPATEASQAWAHAAQTAGRALIRDPDARRANLRHGDTWFVGVDALDTDPRGGLGDVPLTGPWQEALPADLPLHRAQLSVVFPGYPKRDANESVANHRYRVKRKAAHVDGVLPLGPERRRFAREFHAYVLGIHVNNNGGAPTVYWRGSHRIMQQALQNAIGTQDPGEVDITEAYQAARRVVFDTCDMVHLQGEMGESFLLHRFTLHGTEIWHDGWAHEGNEDGRMTAFFRPECAGGGPDWLRSDEASA